MASSTRRFRLSGAHAVVLVFLVLLSCGAAVASALAVPARYSATAKLVLIGPNVSATGQASNPFLDFSSGLSITADVLALSSETSQTADSVVASGGTSSYQTVSSGGSSEPILAITSEAPTKAQAIWTAKLLIVSIQADLAARQTAASVPANLRVTMVSVSAPDQASRQLKTTAELAIAVLVGGLVVSIGIVVLLDRRRLRAPKAASVQARDGSVIEDDATESDTRSDVAAADVATGGIPSPPRRLPDPKPASVGATDDSAVENDATVTGDDATVTGNRVADVAADAPPPRRRRVRLRTPESSTVSAMDDPVIEANATEIGVAVAEDQQKRAADGVRSYPSSNESANGAQPDAESIDSDLSDEDVLDASKATAAADGR
jgi:hypothetical protein